VRDRGGDGVEVFGEVDEGADGAKDEVLERPNRSMNPETARAPSRSIPMAGPMTGSCVAPWSALAAFWAGW